MKRKINHLDFYDCIFIQNFHIEDHSWQIEAIVYVSGYHFSVTYCS